MLFLCDIANRTKLNFEQLLNEFSGNNIDLSFGDILVGTACNKNIPLSQNERLLIEELLIILKRKLILQRENKRVLENAELTNLINEHFRIYKYNKWNTNTWVKLFGNNLINNNASYVIS